MLNAKEIARRFKRQKSLLSLLAVLVSAVLVLGSAFAWFTQTDTVNNTLKTQDLPFSFEITEDFKTPERVDPSVPVPKVVNVTNTGEVPGFVRLLVLPEIVSETGELLEATPGVTFTYDDLNTTSWADGGDGYYYYLGILDPGQMTEEPLFTSVTLASGLGPEYNNAKMKIEIKLEASEAVRAKYRDGWWHNGDVPPSSTALLNIDTILKDLAQ